MYKLYIYSYFLCEESHTVDWQKEKHLHVYVGQHTSIEKKTENKDTKVYLS